MLFYFYSFLHYLYQHFHFVSSANNLCNQFGPGSDLTKCLALSGSKLFDTDGIPERIFRKR